MADYEDLLKKMAVVERELKDKISGLQKLYKSLSKSMEKGDLKSWNRDLGVMRASLKEQEILMEGMQTQVDDFGIRA